VQIFRRKNKWQQLAENVAGQVTTAVAKTPAVRTGAAAAAGAVAVTAASAAISAYRRRPNS
jgi:hypothetical protein